MNYINMRGQYGVETIEDLAGLTILEKRRLLREYLISDKTNHYYFSQRSTNEFK